jgi:hypothetical protein
MPLLPNRDQTKTSNHLPELRGTADRWEMMHTFTKKKKGRPTVEYYHDCPKCRRIVRTATMENQSYIQMRRIWCLTCDVEMTPHLNNFKDSALPLEPTYKYQTHVMK